MESKNIHYIPSIHQPTTCLADTTDMSSILPCIFNFSILRDILWGAPLGFKALFCTYMLFKSHV